MSRSSRRTSQRNVAQPDAAITEDSAAEVQLASAPTANDDAASQADVFETGTGNAVLAEGDEAQRLYISAYGEKARDHTISGLSAGDKVVIWVEEGSSTDYTYVVQGADIRVSVGQSSILLKNVSPDELRDFVLVEQDFVMRIDPIEDPIEIVPPSPADAQPTVSPSGTEAQPGELDGETTAAPTTETVASETGGTASPGGAEPEWFYVYSYGERAGNHTISDLSAGDKVVIWVEEGSTDDYTFSVIGTDTLVTIGQSTILLENFVTENIRDFVSVEQNWTFHIQPIWDSEPIEVGESTSAPESVSAEVVFSNTPVGTAPINPNLEIPRFVSLHVYGTDESDVLFGDSTSRAVFAGGGNDTIIAGRSDVVLAGDNGNDLLLAHSGRNTLFGDGGNDTIIGNSGDDQIEGGSGNNYLAGGSGSDEFVYWGPLDFTFSDTIVDFDSGDRISIFSQNEPIDVSFERQDAGTLVRIGQSSVLLENFFAENVRDFVTVNDDVWYRIDRLELTPSAEFIW